MREADVDPFPVDQRFEVVAQLTAVSYRTGTLNWNDVVRFGHYLAQSEEFSDKPVEIRQLADIYAPIIEGGPDRTALRAHVERLVDDLYRRAQAYPPALVAAIDQDSFYLITSRP